LTKFMTTFALGGTTSVPPPLRKPLNVKGPAMSSNVTVFVAASYESHFSCPSAAATGALAESLTGAEAGPVGFGPALVRGVVARVLGTEAGEGFARVG
jgi:hypothetical protein